MLFYFIFKPLVIKNVNIEMMDLISEESIQQEQTGVTESYPLVD